MFKWHEFNLLLGKNVQTLTKQKFCKPIMSQKTQDPFLTMANGTHEFFSIKFFFQKWVWALRVHTSAQRLLSILHTFSFAKNLFLPFDILGLQKFAFVSVWALLPCKKIDFVTFQPWYALAIQRLNIFVERVSNVSDLSTPQSTPGGGFSFYPGLGGEASYVSADVREASFQNNNFGGARSPSEPELMTRPLERRPSIILQNIHETIAILRRNRRKCRSARANFATYYKSIFQLTITWLFQIVIFWSFFCIGHFRSKQYVTYHLFVQFRVHLTSSAVYF